MKAAHERSENYDDYLSFANNAFGKAVKFPKKIVFLINNELIPSRSFSTKRLGEIFPHLDLSVFEDIDYIFKNFTND